MTILKQERGPAWLTTKTKIRFLWFCTSSSHGRRQYAFMFVLHPSSVPFFFFCESHKTFISKVKFRSVQCGLLRMRMVDIFVSITITKLSHSVFSSTLIQYHKMELKHGIQIMAHVKKPCGDQQPHTKKKKHKTNVCVSARYQA